jgi:oxazoline/thiazoline synthase
MLPLTPGAVVAFKLHLRPVPLQEGAVLLLAETVRYLLPKGALARVARLIDGRRSVADLLAAAAPELAEAQVILALDHFDAAGYLSLAEATLAPEEQAFWQELGAPPATQTGVPVGVCVEATRDAPPAWRAWMEEAVNEAGLRVVASEASAVRIVLTPDYLSPELARWERAHRQEGLQWLPVKPSGVRPLLGPLFTAQEGPCWACLSHALRRNRPVEQFAAREAGPSSGDIRAPSQVGASLRIVFNLAAMAVARHLHALPGAAAARRSVLELKLDSLETVVHAARRRPQCESCGNPELMRSRGEAPVVLQAAQRYADTDGGYRVCSPQETYERYRELVSPVTGVVTHLGPMPGRHGPERPVYTCGYLVCPAEGTLHSNAFDKACAGKGRSEDQARASALCEALERASSVFQGDEARSRSTSRALGPAAIDPDRLQLFSERQFLLREQLAPDADLRRQVPLPFDADAAIDWTPAWSLTCNERRYLPLAYCFSEVPEPAGARFCRHNPNGTAAGNCLEEAVLHGLLELVERDAAAIWWYNRVRRPAVDLDAFEDAFFAHTLAAYRKSGCKLWVLDLTHDLGIATFAAVNWDSARGRHTLGLGCHLDARLAIQRALTELNQLFLAEGSTQSQAGLSVPLNADFLLPDGDAGLLSPGALSGAEHVPRGPGGADLRADILGCVARLGQRGLEVIVMDKTRPDIGASVAQVVVPGLRHFWPRFAPGRLYTVAPQLGWLPAPLTEDGLNAVPLFL